MWRKSCKNLAFETQGDILKSCTKWRKTVDQAQALHECQGVQVFIHDLEGLKCNTICHGELQHHSQLNQDMIDAYNN